MTSKSNLAADFVAEITRSEDWAISGPRVLPILRKVRAEDGDAQLAELVEAIVQTGIEGPATAALAYLGDIISEAGLAYSEQSFSILKRYLRSGIPHERLGASAGIGSIMDAAAATHLRHAATTESLAALSAFQLRSSEVIERNVSVDPENPNTFALAV